MWELLKELQEDTKGKHFCSLFTLLWELLWHNPSVSFLIGLYLFFPSFHLSFAPPFLCLSLSVKVPVKLLLLLQYRAFSIGLFGHLVSSSLHVKTEMHHSAPLCTPPPPPTPREIITEEYLTVSPTLPPFSAPLFSALFCDVLLAKECDKFLSTVRLTRDTGDCWNFVKPLSSPSLSSACRVL